LTRRCLEVCAEFRNPVGIVTKSALVRRDVDVLQRLAHEASVTVSSQFRLPITTLRARWNLSRPRRMQFEAMKTLSEAGIDVGIGIAPTVPGLTSDIPELLQRAKDCGATRAVHQHAASARQRGSIF